MVETVGFPDVSGLAEQAMRRLVVGQDLGNQLNIWHQLTAELQRGATNSELLLSWRNEY